MEQGTEEGKEMKIPEGWPTKEMIEAGVLEMLGRPFDKMVPVRESVAGIFKAMLAAAPTPPAEKDEPVGYIDERGNFWSLARYEIEVENRRLHDFRPLYTRPQADEGRAWKKL